MFMTDRGDPRAIFDVVYGCSPTWHLQKELRFKARDTLLGGHICVKLASGIDMSLGTRHQRIQVSLCVPM